MTFYADEYNKFSWQNFPHHVEECRIVKIVLGYNVVISKNNFLFFIFLVSKIFLLFVIKNYLLVY